MTERSYTMRELDALRNVVQEKYIWGRYNGPLLNSSVFGHSRSCNETEMLKSVEEQVRTHMLAGHTAEDLLASETQP